MRLRDLLRLGEEDGEGLRLPLLMIGWYGDWEATKASTDWRQSEDEAGGGRREAEGGKGSNSTSLAHAYGMSRQLSPSRAHTKRSNRRIRRYCILVSLTSSQQPTLHSPWQVVQMD